MLLKSYVTLNPSLKLFMFTFISPKRLIRLCRLFITQIFHEPKSSLKKLSFGELKNLEHTKQKARGKRASNSAGKF